MLSVALKNFFSFSFWQENYFSFEFDSGGTLSLNTFCLAAEPKINYLQSSNGVSKLISMEHKTAFPLWNALK